MNLLSLQVQELENQQKLELKLSVGISLTMSLLMSRLGELISWQISFQVWWALVALLAYLDIVYITFLEDWKHFLVLTPLLIDDIEEELCMQHRIRDGGPAQ